MAFLVVYPDADGSVGKVSTSSWASARDATSGLGIFSATASVAAVGASKNVSGRTTAYVVQRSFFNFDTSAITHVPKQAALIIKGLTYGEADLIAVKGKWGGTTLSSTVFNDIEGWTTGDNTNNVTNYSAEVTTWNTTG